MAAISESPNRIARRIRPLNDKLTRIMPRIADAPGIYQLTLTIAIIFDHLTAKTKDVALAIIIAKKHDNDTHKTILSRQVYFTPIEECNSPKNVLLNTSVHCFQIYAGEYVNVYAYHREVSCRVILQPESSYNIKPIELLK